MVLAWLCSLTFAGGIVGLVISAQTWGPTIWGDIAPDWPGGGYGFAGTAGGLGALAVAAMIAPLTRMRWKKSKARSLAWAAASLPGLAASMLFLVVIFGAWRPKKRNRSYSCSSEGGPCWVHEQYPYVWAVGLAATLVAVALVTVLVKLQATRTRTTSDSAEPSAT
ncbi:hypothetical protein G5C60_32435 [Streptomyces sp. HC44]|uniref:Uncharacterized protein n=1 Tax=Streptomyces scabichelini TaxID=2711217 RepID=A0A6G4VDM0_9ACTN|nr:hypothetical protein [Streptomyces scabichelini]NGO12189.1 hypothetical protein [Streptomyces scabichelini]